MKDFIEDARILGFEEGLDDVGVTYDDDPESPCSVAYDEGRAERRRQEGIDD